MGTCVWEGGEGERVEGDDATEEGVNEYDKEQGMYDTYDVHELFVYAFLTQHERTSQTMKKQR